MTLGPQFDDEMKSLNRQLRFLVSQNRRLYRLGGFAEPSEGEIRGLTETIPTAEGKLTRTRQKIDSTLASNAGALGIMWPADVYIGHDTPTGGESGVPAS